MLLIDGVKYELWIPPSEAHFEQMVKENAPDIFGAQSIYFDVKQKLTTKSGIGSIPDGYVLILSDQPQWYIVEVELSSHPVYEHIVPQVSKFGSGIKNLSSQKVIVDVLHDEISEDRALTEKIKSKIGLVEIHKFLSTLISQSPRLVIIIDEETEELSEAVEVLKLETRVIEFQTFVRKADGVLQYAHMFEPLRVLSEVGLLSQRELLEELRSRFIAVKPEIKPSKVYKDYCFIPIKNHEKIHTEWLLWGMQKLSVELHLQRANRGENYRLLKGIESLRDELVEQIGEQLTFRFPWRGNWARVYTARPLEFTDELKEWAVEVMIRFYDVFQPILDEIDS
jgi:hypothetical protein